MDNTRAELEDVVKRIETCEGSKQGRMLVKGTLLVDGDEIIRTTFDNTTSSRLLKHSEELREACENFARIPDPSDKLEYIRVDCNERTAKDGQYQIMIGCEDQFKAIVVQDYKLRDLRERSSTEQKESKGYKYLQKNYFFPSLDK